MIEFSENLSIRYEGVPAVSQRAFYRLSVREGEIPYFNGGIETQEFFYGDNITEAVGKVLADFNESVSVSDNRVRIGDIVLDLPGGLV